VPVPKKVSKPKIESPEKSEAEEEEPEQEMESSPPPETERSETEEEEEEVSCLTKYRQIMIEKEMVGIRLMTSTSIPMESIDRGLLFK
jgi:hypothetical protein